MPPERVRSEIAWGGLDQVLSSATNLGLSILAGRLLGASGLGLIFLGFSAYLLALSLVRGFITAPCMVATSALDPDLRAAATRKCMTLIVSAAASLTVLMVVLGLVIPDPLGKGLLVFAPWIGVGIIQDQWRAVLFRDQRGRAAALNDGTWAVGMLIALPFAWAAPSEWSVAAVWGFGAALSATLGWWQVHLRPSRFAPAAAYWKRELRRLGSWLAADSVLNATSSQMVVIILSTILSTSDLGGIRVVLVVFAPMTLINEALAFPGVPLMARALASSMAMARRWAWRLGLGAVAAVSLYIALLVPFDTQILTRVFGPEFSRFTELVFPVAFAQLPAATAVGFFILLVVDRRGHSIVLVTIIRAVLTLSLAPLFAAHWGVLGAAWGMAIGGSVSALAAMLLGQLARDIPLPGERRRERVPTAS